jgi:gluconokinase
MTGRTIVIMGPAGSGKSTVGPLVAARLGLTFLDGDDYHDAASIASMRSGAGLDDTTQRIPWLRRLNHELRARQDEGSVLACSALRPEYRAVLADGIDDAIFVYLSVREGTLNARLGARTDHFAGPALLPSQLRILDLGDDTITVDGEQPPASVADAVVAILTLPRAQED